MNYIKQLQADNKRLEDQLALVDIGITELFSYLALPKFYEDKLVNIDDVRLRLQEIRNSL